MTNKQVPLISRFNVNMLPDPKETSDTIKFLKKSIKKTWLARV
jgi:hypothetical protein